MTNYNWSHSPNHRPFLPTGNYVTDTATRVAWWLVDNFPVSSRGSAVTAEEVRRYLPAPVGDDDWNTALRMAGLVPASRTHASPKARVRIPVFAWRYFVARETRTPLKVGNGWADWALPPAVTYSSVRDSLERNPHVIDSGCVGTPARPRLPSRVVGLKTDYPLWAATPLSVRRFREITQWVASEVPLPTGSTGRHDVGSYGFKHAIEEGLGGYVSNGEGIIAADLVGIRWETGIPNARLCIYETVYDLIRSRSRRDQEVNFPDYARPPYMTNPSREDFPVHFMPSPLGGDDKEL